MGNDSPTKTWQKKRKKNTHKEIKAEKHFPWEKWTKGIFLLEGNWTRSRQSGSAPSRGVVAGSQPGLVAYARPPPGGGLYLGVDLASLQPPPLSRPGGISVPPRPVLGSISPSLCLLPHSLLGSPQLFFIATTHHFSTHLKRKRLSLSSTYMYTPTPILPVLIRDCITDIPSTYQLVGPIYT